MQASQILPQCPAAVGWALPGGLSPAPQIWPHYLALSYVLTSSVGSDFILQSHRFLTQLEDLDTGTARPEGEEAWGLCLSPWVQWSWLDSHPLRENNLLTRQQRFHLRCTHKDWIEKRPKLTPFCSYHHVSCCCRSPATDYPSTETLPAWYQTLFLNSPGAI